MGYVSLSEGSWNTSFVLGGILAYFQVQAVDGRNPAPVDMVNIIVSHYLQGFIHPRWLAEFQPSTAC